MRNDQLVQSVLDDTQVYIGLMHHLAALFSLASGFNVQYNDQAEVVGGKAQLCFRVMPPMGKSATYVLQIEANGELFDEEAAVHAFMKRL